jgi:hypothetical protein
MIIASARPDYQHHRSPGRPRPIRARQHDQKSCGRMTAKRKVDGQRRGYPGVIKELRDDLDQDGRATGSGPVLAQGGEDVSSCDRAEAPHN